MKAISTISASARSAASAAAALAERGWALLPGAGFLLDGGEVDERAVLETASGFGRPSARDGGRAVWPVAPTAGSRGSTFSVRAGAAGFHTDSQYHERPEDLVCLFMVRPAGHGGVSMLLDVAGALAAVRRHPRGESLLTLMSERAWSWTTPGDFSRFDRAGRAPGDDDLGRGNHVAGPGPGPGPDPERRTSHRVLGADGSIRWRSDNLDEAVGAPYLSAARAIAACFDHSDDALRVPLRPGDLLVVDNTRVMHARTWFNDPDRLLLRVRLWRP